MFLVLLAVVPAFILTVHDGNKMRSAAIAKAVGEAQQLARTAAFEQRDIVRRARELLMSLARLPGVAWPGAARACQDYLADLRRLYPYYANLGVIRPNGEVACSALPFDRTVNLADRSYFRRALETGDFVTGNYQIGRITNKATVNFAYPVRDEAGAVTAVIFLALDLAWLNEILKEVELPRDSIVTVVDGKGIVLARHPDPEPWVGKTMEDKPLLERMLAQGEGGVIEDVVEGELRRAVVFLPLHASDGGKAYLQIGIAAEVVYADAEREFYQHLLSIGIAAVLVVVLAWKGGELFVLRPIHAISAASRRLSAGDYAARAGVPHGAGELGRLASTFDAMADAITLREGRLTQTAAELRNANRALKTLGAGNRALLRATDEPALLEEMCRIAVEVGGYRLAYVACIAEDEPQVVRPVVHVGTNAGFLAGLRSRWGDPQLSPGPTGRAMRSGEPAVSNDLAADPDPEPRFAEMVQLGFASEIALPLRVEDKIIGTLNILAGEAAAFGREEIELLRETADDLAFGIQTLRMRARHAEAERSLVHLAFHDALTGLPNRAQLDRLLERAITEARANMRPAALLAVHLDNLREINEALGYHQGDQLLREIGPRLAGAVADAALVARVGGEEFMILLTDADAERAGQAARRVLQAMEKTFEIAGLALEVRASIGIALFPGHGATPELLVRHANAAARTARRGAEGYAIHSGEPEHDSARRLALGAELRRAIENNQLLLYCQPKIELDARRVCGAEALVRWQHPQRGMVPPGEFIALAEHTGLIGPMTDWVLEAALRASYSTREQGLDVPFAVNVSARNLLDPRLPGRIRGLLATWGIAAQRLQLELTESALMEDPESALKLLTELHAMGVELHIDDFGTGYSSLSYLQRLPVSAVKIDRSFVSRLLTDPGSDKIVRSTIELAHHLNLKVVAEGVESRELLDRLAALGCDMAQGYFIARPMPAHELAAWARRSP